MGVSIMNCLKCGREIEADAVYCAACLQEMERYPVKPGTVILLPSQNKAASKKITPRKKHVPTPEEQIVKLKRQLLFLRIISSILVLAAAALLYVNSRVITELDIQRLLGQNYSTVETTDS